uniref:WAP four-disulfide core domain 3 n=1 Tax=Meleagris gallopavo TaxID=9103 RepID=A0A803YF93_MELGA
MWDVTQGRPQGQIYGCCHWCPRGAPHPQPCHSVLQRSPVPAPLRPRRGSFTPAPFGVRRTKTAWAARSAARWAAAQPAWSRRRVRSPGTTGATCTGTATAPRGAQGCAADICHLPAVPGPCGGHELSFFYNVTSGRCETFPYGGCGGNANRFGTRAACRRACLGHEKPKTGECPVELPELDGPCREECDGDSDCPNALKCCNSSCGLQCLPAAPARKDGFCPASTGLFPSYDCREWCRRDADCPGEEKCCLQGCDYVCLRPAQEKPGICPLSEQAAGSQCQDPCAGDGQCPGDEKCCSSRCGHVCMAPEPDKPGQCPKVRPQLTSEPCTEEDDCLHDRDCPRQEKCCFSGCAMRCSRPAREHPGQCPRAEPCWDPRRRRRNQCLDDSVCRRDEKCCNTGCTWGCVAVPRESSGGASRQCAEECETDAQCLQGQRCTHMGCSHVCVDIPGGRVGVCPISRDASTCMDLCSLDEECPWGQKCCSNGCSHVCMPASLEEPDAAVVPQHGARRCPEQCDADSQCPRGQRCTRTSCGHVCMDMPRGENHGPALSWRWQVGAHRRAQPCREGRRVPHPQGRRDVLGPVQL